MFTADVQNAIDKELSLLTSAVRSSPSQVDALLDPRYREIGASGRPWTRVAIIEALVDETSAEDGLIEASDMNGEQITADLILLTCVTKRAGRRARRSSLWRQSDGNWRLFFHQGTFSEV